MRQKRTSLYEQRKIDNRVNWMIKNKVNWLNPTISPAPKKDGVIESVLGALEYYRPYTDEVVLSIKYMGSYCCMYLHKNLWESTFISRNGYEINRIERDLLLAAAKPIHEKLFAEGEGVQMYVVEAELMPWRALGGGLIDREYGTYYQVHQSHSKFIKASTLPDKLRKVEASEDYQKWLNLSQRASEEVKTEFKHHIRKQYECIRELTHTLPDPVEYQHSIRLYKKQLDIFGKEDEVHFNPFNILKVIDNDGVEVRKDYNLNNNINTDYVIVKTDGSDNQRALDFFHKSQSLELEGIVVKPLKQNLINVAPVLKVRTKAYLQLIYGVNFDKDYDRYYAKRDIKRKLRASILGYELAIQLLAIPRSELTADNYQYKKLLYKLIGEESTLETLDKRL